MDIEKINKLYKLLESIPVTKNNKTEIEEIKKLIDKEDFAKALERIQNLNIKKDYIREGKNMLENQPMYVSNNNKNDDYEEDEEDYDEYEDEHTTEENKNEDYEKNTDSEENDENYDEDADSEENDDDYDDIEDEEEYENNEENNEQSVNLKRYKTTKKEKTKKYPDLINDTEIERIYIGLLLKNPESIYKYYYLFDDCFFEDDDMLNIYKSVLFTEGAKYTPEIAKKGFNFSRDSEEVYELKYRLKEEVKNKKYNMEKIYTDLKKLFCLRKNYSINPIEEIQEKIVEIKNYELYDQMTVEEIESAVNQVSVTNKFKQAILNQNLTNFLEEGRNNLANGLSLPFPIITEVFKGIRKGETMAYAMPSNSGKSRLTIDLAAYTAFVHKKKVLVISNEMSEEKMRLCLITTIINNPDIQKIHGKKLKKTEGELLEFKFRPDSDIKTEVDEEGFIIQKKGESQAEYIKRLSKISKEFNDTIEITNWVNRESKNSIYFINITDHTNDELKKVIMNYYYKEKIEYVFYDTLKTDTANIGIGEELKKTATILSNIAQNFNIFICSTLQLAEGATLPINLSVVDLAVSRTVKEVLDTLCLMKQINRENYDEYQYSLKEVDTEFFDLIKYDDPDMRYYACVIDKNRAGAKPKLLFRLNLAYNMWEELGYLSLKQ